MRQFFHRCSPPNNLTKLLLVSIRPFWVSCSQRSAHWTLGFPWESLDRLHLTSRRWSQAHPSPSRLNLRRSRVVLDSCNWLVRAELDFAVDSRIHIHQGQDQECSNGILDYGQKRKSGLSSFSLCWSKIADFLHIKGYEVWQLWLVGFHRVVSEKKNTPVNRTPGPVVVTLGCSPQIVRKKCSISWAWIGSTQLCATPMYDWKQKMVGSGYSLINIVVFYTYISSQTQIHPVWSVRKGGNVS